MPNLPRSLQVTTLISILVALWLILASCSEDPELIGTDMESQQAPPFTLIDHRGETVQLSDLRGKAVAMTFIFTNCPDVCPLIINRMSMAYEQVPDDKKDDIAMVAITVDPERDDPETMAEYLESRSVPDLENWYGLTGDLETLEPIWQAYFVTPGERFPADPEVQEAIEAGEHDHEEFIEEGLDDTRLELELLDQQFGEVLSIECCGEREHRVVEPDVLELHNRIGDFTGPVAAAALDHADREAMQRDIEDVPTRPFEPGSHSAQFVMLLAEQDTPTRPGQGVGGGQSGQAGTDYHHVVFILGVFQEIFRHRLVFEWISEASWARGRGPLHFP
jgi:protein SCO1/2